MAGLEHLNSDIVEDEFIRIFKPIHLTQEILCSIRVKIKHKFISVCSIKQILLTLITLVYTLISVFFLVEYSEIFNNKDISQHIVTCIQSSTTMIMYIMLMLSNKFMNTKQNSKMYVTMQKIDRILKMNNIEKLYKYQFMLNSLMIIISFSYIFIYLSISTTVYKTKVLISIILSTIPGVVDELECLNFFSVLYFLVVRVKVVCKSMNVVNSDKCVGKSNWFHFVEEHDVCVKVDGRKLTKATEEIVKAYTMLRKNYSFYVSILSITPLIVEANKVRRGHFHE